MEDYMKIVDFSKCKGCIHYEQDEMDDPCYECLNNPTKYASEKPLYFEQDPDKLKKKTKKGIKRNGRT